MHRLTALQRTVWGHSTVGCMIALFLLTRVHGDDFAAGSTSPTAARASGERSKSERTPTPATDSKIRHRVAKVFAGNAAPTAEDLLAMHEQIQSISPRVVAATVGVRVDNAHGSGVIISPDGLVLTAAHVAMKANRDASVILSDGKQYQAKTLGMELGLDAGMVKLVSAGPTADTPWPHLKMADARQVRQGQWCLATGHPGGYRHGRQPVLRIGRILSGSESELLTDCTLVGGDSGGPLLDLQGQVIGIHSRIGAPLTANLHVPVTVYNDAWSGLVNSETHGPYLGVSHDESAESARIKQVPDDSPAARAGLKAGDTVVRFDDIEIRNFHELQEYVLVRRPGDKVTLEVLRDGAKLNLEVALGDWAENKGPVRR